MKILIAVHTYYPEKDGVQQVTQYIAEGLAKNHEVVVVTNLYGMSSRAESYHNVRIERIKVQRNKWHVFVGEKDKYIKIIDEWKPDILIPVCTQSWPFDWLRKRIDKLQCIKILYTHGYSECCKQYGIWDNLVKGKWNKVVTALINKHYYMSAHKYIKKYDLVTYLSEHDISVWYAQKYNLKNGKILGNAVEDVFFEENTIIQKKSEQDGKVRFLYVANFSPIKGQEMVMRAYYETSCEDSELILCGSSKTVYYEKLVSLKQELDLQYGKRDVFLLTEKSRDEVLKLYRSSDVFVCGSKWEAYSISLCEAMASYLPVITTAVGNAVEIQGVIIVNSVMDMSKKMEQLYFDKDIRRKLGQEMREYAERNCKIGDKVAWMEQEIERLYRDKTTEIY